MPYRNTEKHLDVAVLGGGFAGVACAKYLGKHFGTGRTVGVIADENHMTFQPMLPEVAGAALAPRHVVNPIRLLCKGAQVYKGDVRHVDLKTKTIEVVAGAYAGRVKITYDHLVIGVGAVIDLSRIAGMAEHAFVLQNVGDAMKLRSGIIARLEEANFIADEERRRRLLDFVIVGGGYSGVETAGQVIDLLKSAQGFYRNVSGDDFSVSLVHSRDRLLPGLSDELAEYTRRELSEMGVKLVLGKRVQAVTARQVFLNDGTKIPAALVVSTVGTAPNPVVVKLCDQGGLPNDRYRIRTDRYLRVEGMEKENLWAIGDCAAIPLAGGEEGEVCPGNAQFAQREGDRAGRNIAALYNGDWAKPFEFTGLGELAAIGHQKAVASIKGFTFSGLFAWWMWRTIYLGKLPGLDRKIRVLVEWTLELVFPRDVNLLTPRYTSGLNETHLEAGDVLFNAGEPAFSFYVVKQGRVEVRDNTGGVVRVIGQGGHFGERALMADKVWRFDAVATESTNLVALSDATFQTLVSSSGSFGRLLAKSATTYKSQAEVRDVIAKIPAAAREAVAAEVMQADPIALYTDSTSEFALELLKKHPHTTYPVIDGDRRIVSVLRRSDFYEWYKSAPEGAHVRDAPMMGLPTVLQDIPVPRLIERYIRGACTKALVADRDNRLLGIVTLADLLTYK